jgi:hypothetical protein
MHETLLGLSILSNVALEYHSTIAYAMNECLMSDATAGMEKDSCEFWNSNRVSQFPMDL